MDTPHNKPSLEEWMEELENYRTVPENWNYEGAYAPQQDAITHLQNIITQFKDFTDNIDDIYPTPLGSLVITWITKDGHVNAKVSSTSISFYHYYDADKSYVTHNLKPISDESLNILKLHISS